jgi:Fe-S cluster assembly protein SufD
VHENASLNFHYDETWHDGMLHATTDLIIEQQRSSSVRYTHAISGGARVTQRLTLKAIGSDSYADIRGKYLLTGNGSADITTLQHHDAPHTKSNLLFKSIVRDTAQMTHHGTIVITKNGAHTESAQHTHTLLLSNGARAISVPNIEVSTHEVQCGHGSAIGRLDEEQLWYLQARGLSYAQAEQILINGFFNDVL